MIEVLLSVVGAEADQESEALLQMHAAQIPFLEGISDRDPDADTGFGTNLPVVIMARYTYNYILVQRGSFFVFLPRSFIFKDKTDFW